MSTRSRDKAVGPAADCQRRSHPATRIGLAIRAAALAVEHCAGHRIAISAAVTPGQARARIKPYRRAG